VSGGRFPVRAHRPVQRNRYSRTRSRRVSRRYASAEPNDHLLAYADLLAWGERRGLLPAPAAARLRALAEQQPAAAAAVLGQAVELREAIYRLLLAHAHESAPPPADLAALNTALTQALAHAHLTPADGGYALSWDLEASAALEGLLWPVAYSAADLLATPEQLARVGQCQDDRGCGWVFLDLTKNHSRRWCAMDDCGNRAKAKRHYERKKIAI
jgi:predicted RNA-binding Zn ribbon-like protein